VSPRKRRLSPQEAARVARAHWAQAADLWAEVVGPGEDFLHDSVPGPALVRVLGPVRGLDVLDLGCGTGYFTRELARRGARATGVDWSEGMLDVGRAEERRRPRGVRYRCLDAARVGSAFPPRSFDRVTASMSLMDMPDPARAIRGAARLLRPGGRVVVSVAHPVHTAPVGEWQREGGRHPGHWLLDDYFEERATVIEWRIPRHRRTWRAVHWHRTFTGWFRLFASAGLYVHTLVEPHPTATTSAPHPHGAERVPFWVVFDARPLRA
jgi:SAM-dependent methyltransferase